MQWESGHVEVVVQDIAFRTDNILFRKEKYYSPGQKQTYLGELPAGYRPESERGYWLTTQEGR